ncbi:MAG: UbiA family prenyltransferase [Thermoanaerobaculia bacterium]|nr:UbiA family prenyltransferase [Thermoanaerobaculia bacterium]
MRVARPGLIVSHLWVYLLPLALAPEAPGGAYWIGALYVTLPLGLLIYGWNDFRDGDVDALSPRKRESRMAHFFGYRLSPGRRRALPLCIVAANLPFLALALVSGELPLVGWAAVMVAGNWLYNGPGPRLSRRPGMAEITATGIYLCILWLGAEMAGVALSWPVWVLAAAAILVFQIAGAIVDLPADRAVGKRTFAVAAGETVAAAALAAAVLVKAVVFWGHLAAPPPALINGAAAPLLLARPSPPVGNWAGATYVYFAIADWACLALLAL